MKPDFCYKLPNNNARVSMRLLLVFLLTSICAKAMAADFPRPAGLEPAVRFWTKVYTEVTTNQGYLHDAVNLSVIYDTLDLPDRGEWARRDRLINEEKRRYEAALRALGAGKRSNLDEYERKALAAWPKGTSSSTFKAAAAELRFQLGQSDRFKEGLIRSGQWKPHIRNVLSQFNLPGELDVLPHVESSFNPNAYSKVAAAGMWQFMPATARQYMRVDHIIDERMDPFLATEGAAKLLKRNFEITGTWPLALTAYNHGAGGMVRAARAMGSTDIDRIVAGYRGPAFGFASRNFYASFLAALEVDRNAEKYFGKVTLALPVDFDTLALHDYVPAKSVAESVGLSLEELRQYNPGFLDTVWTGEKYIPKGYTIRVPRARLKGPLAEVVAGIPSIYRFAYQKPDVLHKIRSGESLSVIASRYNTSVSKLMALNGLNSHMIRAGQTLKLPGVVQAENSVAVAATTAASRVAETGGAGAYVIQSGDSLWSIARRFNISQRELVAWNNISNKHHIKPGQTLKISGASSGEFQDYVIQPGDSLWAIARRFNVSTSDLLQWNGLKDGRFIKAGQTLRLASN